MDSVYVNRYESGVGWGEAVLIETDDAGRAFAPRVELDSAGIAIAVWYQYDGSRYSIYANRFEPTAGWGTAELIETDDVAHVTAVELAGDGNGNFIAVWKQSASGGYTAWSNRYEAGSGWDTATNIGPDSGSVSRYDDGPRVASDATGDSVAIWVQTIGGSDLVYANRLPGTRFLCAFPIALFRHGMPDPGPGMEIDYRGLEPGPEERQFLNELGSDILVLRPKLVLLAAERCQACPKGFRIPEYLDSLGWSEHYLSGYEPIGTIGGHDVFLHDERRGG